MDYFSRHTDQGELFDFLRLNTKEKLNNIFLGHGEEKHFLVLGGKLVGLDYKNVNFPFSGEKFAL
jgi:predicted metal-dependent RNase